MNHILILILFCLWLTPAFALDHGISNNHVIQNNRGAAMDTPSETMEQAPMPDGEDMKVIAVLEILELMDMVEEMDMMKDLDQLVEENQNEN
jgi:hypothetical protein